MLLAFGNKRALIYKFMPNESLGKFIFVTRDEDRLFNLEKLQNIAMGIAEGIEYRHQGCDLQILHFDIRPHNVLLNHNFNPKISDLDLEKLYSKKQSVVFMTTTSRTMGYIAPKVLFKNFRKMSSKLDVYSFGMLLLKMVEGRKNIDVTVESMAQVYFQGWVYNCLDRAEELGIKIENHERDMPRYQKNLQLLDFGAFSGTPWPSLKASVHMLEGEVNSLIMPRNPFNLAMQIECRPVPTSLRDQ